jgi:hypothetical protein
VLGCVATAGWQQQWRQQPPGWPCAAAGDAALLPADTARGGCGARRLVLVLVLVLPLGWWCVQ